jgi:iron complex outermembrane receptor protein
MFITSGHGAASCNNRQPLTGPPAPINTDFLEETTRTMHTYAVNVFSASPAGCRLRRRAISFATAACLWLVCATLALAQTTGAITGNVTDNKGGLIPKATVTLRSVTSGKTTVVSSDASGHFVSPALPAGAYDVEASAPGFTTFSKKAVTVPGEVNLSLQIGSATSEITVDADATHSEAAALAPMDALLSETSARTEITSAMIQNFMSPVADYGEAVQMAPATFTLNGNGIGLGQSKTYFRGFPDGDYDIKFDGIPWSDTNSVSHHSWAFFPTQFLGGIDFDRSPGTASTIGYAPFGGSINLLSKDMSPVQNIRATFSGGSFNTYLYDVQYDSGTFGPGHKFNLNADVHHLQSHGYQTGNNQTRNAGDLKFVYSPSNTFTITGFSGVIWLDSNTPNLNATRCQMFGAPASNPTLCAGTGPGGLQPFTGAGINFLLTNNADPELYFDKQYNFYHVPTDFEYVGVHKEFAHNITLDIKPYTYNYDNSEKYSNAVPITDDPTQIGTTYAPLGVKVTALCNQLVTKKGVSAEPCSVDKYNSYRTYGETSELTQVSKFGNLRAGMWYVWSKTNRHQYPTDPLSGYKDQELPNFAEKFVQDSYQPYVEYQYHVTKKLDFTPGVKFSYDTIGTQQFADNGKTIGCFQTATAGCNPNTNPSINPNQFISNGGSYFAVLPSASLNYRIKNNWSAYVQAAQGSIVPPSNVFDFQQGTSGTAIPPQVLPKQQKNTTYQTGTVFKLKKVTFDADYYYIHFDNSYSSTTNLANGEPIYFVQPSSITQGLEGESNIYIKYGLSVYLNASYDKATYRGTLAATCTGSTTACAAAGTLNVTAPSGLNVAQTPSDIETEGVTYQHKAFDFGYFNKRVGTFYLDNGAYHNQATINPFTTSNLYLNYTLRYSGRFNNTKFRVSLNNLFDDHNITGDSIAGSPNNITLNANGTTYTDPFNTVGQTPISGADALSVLPARSIMFAVTFGFSPHGR